MKAKKSTLNHNHMVRGKSAYEDWILISQEELKLAKKALEGDNIVIIPTVVLTQQSAEKALKAYLVSRKSKFPKTHDLVDLLWICISFDDEFFTLLEEVANLNPYIIKCRYPDDAFYIPTLEAIQDCIADADTILNFVREKIFSEKSC